MGSKSRFVKEILPIILKDRTPEQWYVEPFAGGMNVISEVSGNRLANDINRYLISMWKELMNGWIPKKITKEEYNDVRTILNNYPPYYVGWVGFNCSYSGKWFGGFAGETKTKVGTIRDYQTEAIKNVEKQVKKMAGVIFENEKYNELCVPKQSIIYCDIPYFGTTDYKTEKFNHDEFWMWCREMKALGHTIFVSEYDAPNDFECVWSKNVKSSLSANGVSGGNKNSIEKLFKL
jgi:DNA adenine methylase